MGLFKKKKEVVDLRPKDADMPIPVKMRERLLPSKSSVSGIASAASSTDNSGGGGFFGFFGGGSDSSGSGSSSSSVSPSVSSAVEEQKTDFWGNPVSTSSSSSSNSSLASSSSSNANNDSQIGEIAYKLSRFTDRIELLEKKIDRLQRKLGISTEKTE